MTAVIGAHHGRNPLSVQSRDPDFNDTLRDPVQDFEAHLHAKRLREVERPTGSAVSLEDPGPSEASLTCTHQGIGLAELRLALRRLLSSQVARDDAVGIPIVDQPASIDQKCAGAQAFDYGHIVADKQDRTSLAGNLAHLA